MRTETGKSMMSALEEATMARFGNFGWRQCPLPRAKESNNAPSQEDRLIVAGDNYSAYGYESPRLMVIGRVRKFSTGSSSSGKADANSQYYW
jgi:hypothetical protein